MPYESQMPLLKHLLGTQGCPAYNIVTAQEAEQLRSDVAVRIHREFDTSSLSDEELEIEIDRRTWQNFYFPDDEDSPPFPGELVAATDHEDQRGVDDSNLTATGHGEAADELDKLLATSSNLSSADLPRAGSAIGVADEDSVPVASARIDIPSHEPRRPATNQYAATVEDEIEDDRVNPSAQTATPNPTPTPARPDTRTGATPYRLVHGKLLRIAAQIKSSISKQIKETSQKCPHYCDDCNPVFEASGFPRYGVILLCDNTFPSVRASMKDRDAKESSIQIMNRHLEKTGIRLNYLRNPLGYSDSQMKKWSQQVDNNNRGVVYEQLLFLRRVPNVTSIEISTAVAQWVTRFLTEVAAKYKNDHLPHCLHDMWFAWSTLPRNRPSAQIESILPSRVGGSIQVRTQWNGVHVVTPVMSRVPDGTSTAVGNSFMFDPAARQFRHGRPITLVNKGNTSSTSPESVAANASKLDEPNTTIVSLPLSPYPTRRSNGAAAIIEAPLDVFDNIPAFENSLLNLDWESLC